MGNTVDLIKSYIKTCYVETGSSAGDGIEKALAAGVAFCFGIECDNDRRRRSEVKFDDDERVKIYAGQSERFLSGVIEEASQLGDMIIFLDAHKVSKNAMETYPLLFELNEIKKSGVKNAVIMIDDVRLFDDELKAPLETVISYIKKINPSYIITYENSDTNAKDVLVAHL